MSFTPQNYLMAERALDQISTEATQFFNKTDDSITRLTAAAASLSSMGADWATTVAFIDSEAQANPVDEQWQVLLARKDKIVSSFIEMRDLAIAVQNAAVTVRG